MTSAQTQEVKAEPRASLGDVPELLAPEEMDDGAAECDGEGPDGSLDTVAVAEEKLGEGDGGSLDTDAVAEEKLGEGDGVLETDSGSEMKFVEGKANEFANVQLEFEKIWEQVRVLKFQKGCKMRLTMCLRQAMLRGGYTYKNLLYVMKIVTKVIQPRTLLHTGDFAEKLEIKYANKLHSVIKVVEKIKKKKNMCRNMCTIWRTRKAVRGVEAMKGIRKRMMEEVDGWRGAKWVVVDKIVEKKSYMKSGYRRVREHVLMFKKIGEKDVTKEGKWWWKKIMGKVDEMFGMGYGGAKKTDAVEMAKQEGMDEEGEEEMGMERALEVHKERVKRRQHEWKKR